MKGTVLNHTRDHACPAPIRFWWRRLGVGARWQCLCGAIWQVERRFQFVAQAGNSVHYTQWYKESA